jgi:hypothetical protein
VKPRKARRSISAVANWVTFTPDSKTAYISNAGLEHAPGWIALRGELPSAGVKHISAPQEIEPGGYFKRDLRQAVLLFGTKRVASNAFAIALF